MSENLTVKEIVELLNSAKNYSRFIIRKNGGGCIQDAEEYTRLSWESIDELSRALPPDTKS